MKQALTDVSARGVWTDEQRRALRGAFTALVEAFDGLLLLKGERKTATTTIDSVGALSCSFDCAFKPRTVMVLDLVSDTASGPVHSANVALTWQFTSTPSGGTVIVTDALGVIPSTGTFDLTVFIEKD